MNDELTATLSPQEWDVIGNALSQRPYIEVSNLIPKLMSQLRSQTPPPPEKKDE